MEDALVFENGRGKLAHENIGVGNALAGGDDILFAAKLCVGFLKNFERLVVLRL